MSKKKKESEQAFATLTLSVSFEQLHLVDLLEAAKEIVKKATAYGTIEGYLDVHRTGRIPVDDLRD